MKHLDFKFLFAILVAMFIPFALSALDFEQDNIKYRTTSDSTVKVINKNNYYTGYYSGHVVIPETVSYNGTTYTVTEIGQQAFYNSTDLLSVTIPPTMKKLGVSAFEGCTGLTAVYISDMEAWYNMQFGSLSASPLTMAHHFYLNGVEVEELIVPESMTKIPAYVFAGCDGLKTVEIPARVTDISNSAFYLCGNITSISVDPENTVYDSRDNCNAVIKKSIYTLCLGCANTTIPSSVYTIGASAFSGRKDLITMAVPRQIETIENSAFAGCTNLAEITLPYALSNLGSAVFRDCTSLTRVDIPSNVWKLQSGLFCGCTNLVEVTIPQDIYELTNAIFMDCTSLTSFTVPNKVTKIANSAFYNCTSLSNLNLGTGVKTIDDFAFYNCTSLTNLTIPGSVSLIRGNAFESCTGLTNLQFSSGNDLEILDWAFGDCTSLTQVTLPRTLVSMVGSAFEGCTAVTSISVNKFNEVFDSRDDCNAVIETSTNQLVWGCKNTVIPHSVTSIGYAAFNHCIDLENLVLPDEIKLIDFAAFEYSKGFDGRRLPKSLEKIGRSAFAHSDVDTIIIPDAVKTIVYDAFLHCSNLREVTIGSHVDSIGSNAFMGCQLLRTIYCKPAVPPVLKNFTFTSYSTANLYVPTASVEAYQAAPYWSNFNHIIGMDFPVEDIPGDMNGDGQLNVSDVINLISLLSTGNVDLDEMPQADFNGDGVFNISDITAFINILVNE